MARWEKKLNTSNAKQKERTKNSPGSSSAEAPKRTQRPVSKFAALQDVFRRQRSMQSVNIKVPNVYHKMLATMFVKTVKEKLL